MLINFYEVLNIQTNATSMDVERAIRIARQRGDIDEQVLTQARNYLLDPKLRKMYDKKLGIKAKAYSRGGEGLSSSMPFWIPVSVIVGILVITGIGVQWSRQDAADKRREANMVEQSAKAQSQAYAHEGRVGTPISKTVSKWENGNLMSLPSPQYQIKTTNRQNEFSAFDSVLLTLSIAAPDDEDPEYPQMVLIPGGPIVCEGECRVQIDFDDYNRFTFPMQSDGQQLKSQISDSFIKMWTREGSAVITLPDADKTQFVLNYPALSLP